MRPSQGNAVSSPAPATDAGRRLGERAHGHAKVLAEGVQVEHGAESSGPTVFAAMPFDPSFDDVYYIAIKGAVTAVGARAVRVDLLLHATDAVDVTHRQLQNAAVVVADVSHARADVMYELGFAQALGKPVVMLCSSPLSELPFVVRNRDTILYAPGRIHLLTPLLTDYLRSTLGVTARG